MKVVASIEELQALLPDLAAEARSRGAEFEAARLRKDQQKAEGQAKQAQAKLGNADFIARAKEDIVQENRDRLAEAQAEIARLGAALARMA